MRPIYGCPENFRDSLTYTPTSTFPQIFHGRLFWLTLWVFFRVLYVINALTFVYESQYFSLFNQLQHCTVEFNGCCWLITRQNLPPSVGLLEATVAALPSWTHVLTGFPVVHWPTFAEYIRSHVNILATEYHLQELVCQLQLMGQVSAEMYALSLLLLLKILQ